MTDNPKKESSWDKMVHASFRKVVAFDLLCIGIGIVIGIGIGVYLIAGSP
ncbi:hypothetical protein [Nitrosarchaeum sp. AC2]|nr:hypothetical protein [Nitrosarchaeum sp. AC2]MCE9652432.1 hypothetical protein [Nitrosarchaeum sp.]